MYGLGVVEADVGRVGAESDAKGGIQVSTSCLKNRSCSRVARAASISCNSVVMLRIKFPPILVVFL